MKRTVVIVGGSESLGRAVARIMAELPTVEITTVNTDETPNAPYMATDGANVYYDPKMIESLTNYVPSHYMLRDALMSGALAVDDEPEINRYDQLPENTTKPKFLMQRDHHIRSPRGRR